MTEVEIRNEAVAIPVSSICYCRSDSDKLCKAHTRIAAAISKCVMKERERVIGICLNERKRWATPKAESYVIGAVSNIVAAIEGVPCHSDEPIHPNEYVDSELARSPQETER